MMPRTLRQIVPMAILTFIAFAWGMKLKEWRDPESTD